MKTRTFIPILLLVFTLLIFVESCATGKKTSSSEKEVLYGTWINAGYDETNKYAKIVIDDYWYEYKKSDDDTPIFQCEYSITDNWADSKRNTYYKIIVTHINTDYVPFYIVAKIDKKGDVYEDVVSNLNMPEDFEPDNMLYHHRIYYRKE